MEKKTTTASSITSDGGMSKVMCVLSKLIIIFLQCGACGTEHSTDADAVFCCRCGRSRFVVDLRVRREQFVDAAISKIIDAPDVGAMIDGTPANAVRFAAVVVCILRL